MPSVHFMCGFVFFPLSQFCMRYVHTCTYTDTWTHTHTHTLVYTLQYTYSNMVNVRAQIIVFFTFLYFYSGSTYFRQNRNWVQKFSQSQRSQTRSSMWLSTKQTQVLPMTTHQPQKHEHIRMGTWTYPIYKASV